MIPYKEQITIAGLIAIIVWAFSSIRSGKGSVVFIVATWLSGVLFGGLLSPMFAYFLSAKFPGIEIEPKFYYAAGCFTACVAMPGLIAAIKKFKYFKEGDK